MKHSKNTRDKKCAVCSRHIAMIYKCRKCGKHFCFRDSKIFKGHVYCKKCLGLHVNKFLLLGVVMIFFGIVLAGIYFSDMTKSAPNAKFIGDIGIKTFIASHPQTIFVDDTLSEGTKLKAEEFARVYRISTVNVLTADADLSNSVIIARRNSSNLLAVEAMLGLKADNDEAMVRVYRSSANQAITGYATYRESLFIIGNDESLMYAADILLSSACQNLDKNAILIRNNAGCDGVREYTFCDIG